MSEETPDGTVPSNAELATKVDALASAIDTIKSVLTGAHKDATATTRERLDAPGDIDAEVRRELDRRDARDKEAERDALLGKHDEAIAKLTEQTPQPPRRRIEERMGYHRG
jgi:hypothetical protein